MSTLISKQANKKILCFLPKFLYNVIWLFLYFDLRCKALNAKLKIHFRQQRKKHS
ncbi:hypothetical protein COCNU_01G010420 [Cocos nucifera]|uniref:Uncharacterized protein n=1 Tax=Cocos nucifera TaxID=13894 RepID=A0A8K0HVV3_COCNU|nr:hypothetical protein COCNU_01G010420 [Cocos nucifera]